MPFVRSYYRRSPGAAMGGEPGPVRELDVAVFGPDGVDLLRDRSGHRYTLRSLRFGTCLPGGMADAGFELVQPAARAWPGRAGLRMTIGRGGRTLWWGWVEDVQRRVRGQVESIRVAGLGPWQQAVQRLISPSYSGTVYGDAALTGELRVYCDQISTDYSQVASTGVNIAPLSWVYRRLGDLVKLVCEAGDASGRALLFAVWPPTRRSASSYPASLITNSQVEVGSGAPEGWAYTQWLGTPTGTWCTDIYYSGIHGLKVARDANPGVQEGRWYQTDVLCAASTGYVFDYRFYAADVANIQCYLHVRWYNSLGGIISDAYTTTRSSTGTAGWSRYVEPLTSPAAAHHAMVRCHVTLPDVGGAVGVYDDVFMCAEGSLAGADVLPRAHLWARDLTGYDYLLYTAELASGADINWSMRRLANAVVASYGSGPSYTTWAQDGGSQGAYRRRDWLAAAGAVGVDVAQAVRDATLARLAAPQVEAPVLRLTGPGAVRTRHGNLVWPVELRAGDRLMVADGPEAGLVFLLARTGYADGVVSCTPEGPEDTPLLLA